MIDRLEMQALDEEYRVDGWMPLIIQHTLGIGPLDDALLTWALRDLCDFAAIGRSARPYLLSHLRRLPSAQRSTVWDTMRQGFRALLHRDDFDTVFGPFAVVCDTPFR